MAQNSNVRLDAISLFPGLAEEDRLALLQRAQLRHLRRGEPLVRQGESADTIYYVLRGRFDVLRDGTHLVAEIGAGEPVGEIAFFAGLTRTADVVAARDSEVLGLSRADWADLSLRLPALNEAVLRSLGHRLAAATATAPVLSPKVPGAIGLCAAGPEPVPQALIAALEAAFRAAGEPLISLRARDLPEGLDPAQAGALSQWLALRETEGRLLIVTGEGHEGWDHAALRQCDHLVLCGRLKAAQHGPVQISALERFATPLFRQRQTSLVLWRESSSDSTISDTVQWLEARAPHLHHHIALDQRADFARLYRFLSGRALGAVFGGGGAFGAAHIGALRALHAAGMRFDLAGGTSIGSIIALALSSHLSPQRMIDDFEHFMYHQKALGKLSVPRYGLFDSHHVDAILRTSYGTHRIEDLALNGFTVAANMTTNDLQVQRHGPIWQAIRGSVAIPGALPPMITDTGEVLVDGGIMNNVPVSVMRGLKLGPNVIFSLSPGQEWRVKSRYSDLPSRGRLLWQTLTRQRDTTDLPRLGEVIGRAMQVTSERNFKAAGSDLLLALPGLLGLGLLSFRQCRAQEQLGYEFTSRLLEGMGGTEGLMRWQSDWQG